MNSPDVAHFQFVLINRLATPIGAIVILILVARHSDELLGQYALVMTFYFIMQTIPLLGLTPYVMREVARYPEKTSKYFFSIGALSMLGCAGVDLACWAFLQTVDYSDEVRTGIGILGILIFPGILLFIAEIILMSLHRAKPVGIIACADNLTRVLLSVIVLWLDWGLAALLWAMFITRFTAFCAYVAVLRTSGAIGGFELPDASILRATFRVLPPFLVGTLFFVLISRIDFIVLSLYEAIETIGYYAISFRLFEISVIVLTALMMAVFPWVSKQFIGARLHYVVAIRNLLTLFSVGLMFTCFAGVLLAETYVYVLFNPQYPLPVTLTQLFMCAFLIGGLDYTVSGILQASDLQVPDTKAMVAGGMVNLAMLFALVPVLGIYGAFVAKLLGFAIQCALKLRVLSREIGKIGSPAGLARLAILLAALVATAWLFLESSFVVRLAIVVLTGLVTLPLIVVATGMIQPFRLLRFYWRSAGFDEPDRPRALIDLMVADQRRRARQRLAPGDRGAIAALIYRLARFFYLRENARIASFLHRWSHRLTGISIHYDSSIGPGLIVTGRALLHCRAGANLTCADGVEAGPDCVLGDDVTLLSGARLRAGTAIPAGTVVSNGTGGFR